LQHFDFGGIGRPGASLLKLQGEKHHESTYFDDNGAAWFGGFDRVATSWAGAD
jgi:hypothetical protein